MNRKLINVLLGLFLAMPASLCSVLAEETVSEEEPEIQIEEESQEVPAEETIEEEAVEEQDKTIEEEITEEVTQETEVLPEEHQEEIAEEEIVEETETVPLHTDETETPEIPAEFRFDDVMDTSAYFYEPVYWALDNGITKGTGDTTFSPNDTCKRGQFVTFLWRAEGCPEPSSETNPFNDVPEDASYYKAVLWAVEKGITTGKSSTKFAPYDLVTRGQVATFLYRAAGSPEVNGYSVFTDVKKGMSYTNAITWAADKKITTGTDATHFKPDNSCTRGQCVTFLMRMFRDSYNLKRGWQKTDGKWKYIDQNDKALTGLQTINGFRYYFNDNGIMQTGLQTINNKKYFFGNDGKGLTGWKELDGKWYYFENGLSVTGWKKVGSKWYYMDEEGIMLTGWQYIGKNWYYLESSGAMKTGWLKQDQFWCYLESSGAMAAGKVLTINGKKYEFLNNGVMYDKDLVWSEARKLVGQTGTCEHMAYVLTKNSLGMGGTSLSTEPGGVFGTAHQIPLSQARAGDLIVFRNKQTGGVPHVAVFLEGYTSFHGNWLGKATIVDYRYSNYYYKNGCEPEFWRIDGEGTAIYLY